MKLSIDIPTKLEDITLRQYKRFFKVQEQTQDNKLLNAKMIEIFCSSNLDDVMRLKLNDIDEIVGMITKLFDQKPNLIKSFKVNKVEFGFHPQLDDLTLGEYIDLDTFIGDWNNMEKAMNVLYRPITAKLQEKYSIEDYNVNLHPNIVDMPLSAVMSAIFFLWNLGIDLSSSMTNSLEEGQTKALMDYLTSQENGDGINHFMVSLKGILQELKVSLN
tara:strand:- start:4533 stop:5183 length:651 start_codon:yes stop_codon:yes gene_type:complete